MTKTGASAWAVLGDAVWRADALGGTPGVMGFVLSAGGAWDECDNETLVSTLHAELQTALQTNLPPPQWHQVIRERRASFSCRSISVSTGTKLLEVTFSQIRIGAAI